MESVIQQIIASIAFGIVGYLVSYIRRQYRKYNRLMAGQDVSFADIRAIAHHLNLPPGWLEENRHKFKRNKCRR